MTIELNAIFYKATTTVDGGWRLSLDIDSSQVEQIAKISKMTNQVLNVSISAREDFLSTNEDDIMIIDP